MKHRGGAGSRPGLFSDQMRQTLCPCTSHTHIQLPHAISSLRTNTFSTHTHRHICTHTHTQTSAHTHTHTHTTPSDYLFPTHEHILHAYTDKKLAHRHICTHRYTHTSSRYLFPTHRRTHLTHTDMCTHTHTHTHTQTNKHAPLLTTAQKASSVNLASFCIQIGLEKNFTSGLP